ncbi:hypothetical protein J5N97_010863 [Dioscorea zingiberensis]|uniref:KIB1-4 beta-propeller domain-containing protein n=1 Tax=Dioscorea zingiberensis TaxID=325984 RepID=A0A9D5HN21_9LILI|nr:hypothetical protein J5N97_010863 [Dioscorea zingiberensis]
MAVPLHPLHQLLAEVVEGDGAELSLLRICLQGNMIEDRENVLEKIRRYLPLGDYIRLGPICSSWSARARKRHYSLRHGLPYLVMQNPENIEMRFFNLSRQVIGLASYPEVHGRYCCGSSQGWLVTIDFNLEMHLFDPYSSSEIKLPPLPSPQEQHIEEVEQKNRERAQYSGLTEAQVRRDCSVYKVILSTDPRTSSDYIVVAIFEWFKRLALWKPGASTWVTVNSYYPYCRMVDMLWHKGVLYVITDMHLLFTLDVGPFPKLILINSYLNVIGNVFRELRYLVELEGELHLIFKEVWSQHNKTYSFTVFKFNSKNKELTGLKSIGDYALFLGGNHSIAVPSNDECQSDSIYFTDDCTESLHLCRKADLGIFNMKDETVQVFLSSEVYTPEPFPPLWLEARPYPW